MDSYYRNERRKSEIRNLKRFYSKNKHNLFIYGGAVLVGVGVLSAVGIVSALESSHVEEETSFVEILEENKDNTCLDEILEEEEIDIERVDLINKYISLSEKLNTVNLDDVTLNGQELLSPYEISIMMDAYTNINGKMSSEDREKLKVELSVQEKLVNSYIRDSYDFMKDVSLLTSKAKILDSKGLDESSLSDVVIGGRQDNFFAKLDYRDQGKLNHINVFTDDKGLGRLVNSIHNMQNSGNSSFNAQYNSDAPTENDYKYNSARNNYISSAIDDVKFVVDLDYKMNSDGEVQRRSR